MLLFQLRHSLLHRAGGVGTFLQGCRVQQCRNGLEVSAPAGMDGVLDDALKCQPGDILEFVPDEEGEK